MGHGLVSVKKVYDYFNQKGNPLARPVERGKEHLFPEGKVPAFDSKMAQQKK